MLMKKHRGSVVQKLSIAMISLCIFTAQANDVNTGGQKGVIRALSAQTLGKTGMNVGGGLRYAKEYGYVRGPGGTGEVLDANGQPVDREAPQLLSGVGFIGFGLTESWDISVALPAYRDNTGWDKTRAGIGDLELATKLAYPFQKDYAWVTHAYYLKVILPTGSATRGYFPRHSYYVSDNAASSDKTVFSANAVFFNPMLIWSLHFDRLNEKVPVTFNANFGGVVAKKKSSSAVMAALSLEVQPTNWLNFFVEISGESRVKWYTESFDIYSFDNDPFWLTPGAKVTLPKGFYITLAGDFGLSDDNDKYFTDWDHHGYAYSTRANPRFGGQLTIGWNGRIVKRDRDGDGVIDEKDYCLEEKEDLDGVDDEDGCPELDNDNDGMPDATDECPDQEGDNRGCPIVDNDKDGILDSVDRCPWQAEDIDGFQDEDGCPELDNDNDGLPDAKDNCPNKAEDLDSFEDGDGCPDLDNDADGIEDAQDKCPNHKGVAKNSGCPAAKQIQRGRLILSGVTFQPSSSVLTPNSYTILDQVVESLREWKEVRLEIQGHTDAQGSLTANQRLSQRRADSVREYLMSKGVPADRVVAVGYGETRPIADNKTAAGRARNRRVEMHRVD